MERYSGNALMIKEININLVRKSMRFRESVTKQQLAIDTSLSLVTVGTVLNFLLAQNEVKELELVPSNGGRPAKQYQYNHDFASVLIIFPYETGDQLLVRCTVVNLAGKQLFTEDTEVSEIVLTVFEQLLSPIMSAFPSIQSIAFGHPGVETDGCVLISDYKALVGTMLAGHFSELFHIPVVLENDVNAAAVGYASSGRVDPASSGNKSGTNDTIVYLYFPQHHPPGAGILINGKLFRGRHGYAGEVSAVPLNVTWSDTLYRSFDATCEAVTRLIVTLSALLNPDQIIISAEFMNQSHVSLIQNKLKDRLPPGVAPSISIAHNFSKDYETGLITQALAVLESGFAIMAE